MFIISCITTKADVLQDNIGEGGGGGGRREGEGGGGGGGGRREGGGGTIGYSKYHVHHNGMV